MIYELKKDELYKCIDLIDEKTPEPLAVALGNSPGRIFVDHREKPTTGLVWHKSLDIGFHFIGDSFNTNFNKWIDSYIENTIQPEAKKLGMDWFEASGVHQDWDLTIKNIFEHRNLEVQEQHVYLLNNKSDIKSQVDVLPSDYELIKISKPLLISKKVNLSFLSEKILSFWDSVDSFLKKGVGYGIIHHNKIVSVCLSGFVTNQYSATDVETIEGYTGKKLAQIVAEAYARECFTRDLIPYWDCMKENLPSHAVAKKVGFTKYRTYYVHYFQF
ncbi:GNAT family N-acetyltransferase [Bacillus horti]|uniref:GNAT family N-acetyltransferase n=1 Tax=Caldalkalibacillus horti TaxID=77523 RepID=A0ABT9W394_9BACI|nr:GNAT family N-acetyltransferase [Bacillus horti]MDQ0167718.1 hypothetical protein [Bacillus horti]